MPTIWLALLLSAQVPTPIAVTTAPKGSVVSYSTVVADIFDAKCVGCHSSARANGKLNLEDVKAILKGGKHGPAIVAGKADDSLLFKMAAHRVEPVMPPKDKKEAVPLTGDELGKLKAWIDAGAKDDSDVEPVIAKLVVFGKQPPGVHPINALDVSSDGNRVAVGRANVVTIYNLNDGKEIVTLGGHADLVQSVRYSQDGSKLFAGGFGEVIVWNGPPAPPPKKPEAAVPKDQKAIATPAATKADAKKTETAKVEVKPTAAKVEVKPETTKKDDSKKPETKPTVKPTPPPVVEKWTEARRIGPCVYRVLAIDVSPDGKLLATGGGEPSKSGEVKIWSVVDGKLIRSLDGLHSDSVFAVRFSPDGASLATASADKFVKVVNVADGKELKSFEGHTHHVFGVAWKSDGKALASSGADGSVKFWDVVTGEQLRATMVQQAQVQAQAKPYTALCWPADRPKVIASSADGTIREINANNASIAKTYAASTPPDYLYAVAASADGAIVVGGGTDGIAHQFNGVNGQPVRELGKK